MNTQTEPPRHYWQVRELVTIGVFAALIKVSSILVALVGGGMNPLTLVLKNLIFTTLLVVLLFKVRKPGTLLLFNAVSILMSMLLMGGGFFLLPAMLLAGLAAEGVILLFGGYGRGWAVLAGVACYDLLFKLSSLGISWIGGIHLTQVAPTSSIWPHEQPAAPDRGERLPLHLSGVS